ncbi:MAG: Gfo/Idh/MocA family oxidoreductase [Anaerolineales bacterium]|nr:Gfo/Idh/MocA family oxidoreductase [Anaerolineales bacterium]
MKFLIVGLGGIGQRHLRNLLTVLGEQAEIRAVSPRTDLPVLTDKLTVEQGITLQEKYGLHIYPDLDSGLGWHPDAVFICTPSSMHVPQAIQAARAGAHLFIEKPLSHTLDSIEELVAEIEKRHLVAVVGYQMRFHPGLQRLRALLQEGKVGRLLAVHAEIGEYLPGWHPYEDYRKMYASQRALGGGVILSQIHEMDYLYWLFGLPRRLFALGGQFSRLEVDVEDTADILLEFQVEGRPLPVSLHEDYLQRPPSRSCKVVGDAGKIILDFPTASLTFYDAEGQEAEKTVFSDFQRNQMFLAEIRHFWQALHGQPHDLVSLRDGIQSLRMALAAKESLETGSVIYLENIR